MIRILESAVLAAAVSLVPSLAAAEEGTDIRDTKRALAKRYEEYVQALKKRDLAALDQIWADGYTFTNGRGEFLTKKQRMENIRSGATQFEAIEREDEEIRVFDHTAVSTGRVILKAQYGGAEGSGQYRHLMVWVHRQGRWQIAANQITPILKR